MKPKHIPNVPMQTKGGFHDTESQIYFDNPQIASQQFTVLKERFLSIDQWKEYCGEGFADFKLYDSKGNYIERHPQVNDFIKIDIPGPGNFEAQGFDWVQITDMNEEPESFAVTCRPSKIPGNNKNNHIAHFYHSEATSTFTIKIHGNCIKAGIYGRNESPNFNASFLDKVRNLLVAAGGMVGISKIQWKRLSDGFLGM